MSSEKEIRDVAQRFFDAIERADVQAVSEIYADDAKIWHASEGKTSTKAENLARLKHSTATWKGRRYEDRDVRVFPGGFVQRHLLVREHNGKRLEAPACLVCEVSGGHITRLYEYFDNQQMAAWRVLD